MLNGGAPFNNSLKGVLMLTTLAKANINLIFLVYLFIIVLIIVVLPNLSLMVGNRFDFIIASMITIWFSPMVEREHLLVTLIAFVILSGILIEKYTEGLNPFLLGTAEKWGIVSYWLSMALMSTYIGDQMDQYVPSHYFISIYSMLAAILILAWKLKKNQTPALIALQDYHRLNNASA
jgi:hypothetical protein